MGDDDPSPPDAMLKKMDEELDRQNMNKIWAWTQKQGKTEVIEWNKNGISDCYIVIVTFTEDYVDIFVLSAWRMKEAESCYILESTENQEWWNENNW